MQFFSSCIIAILVVFGLWAIGQKKTKKVAKPSVPKSKPRNNPIPMSGKGGQVKAAPFRTGWYDEQHFYEAQALFSDHDMRDVLQEFRQQGDCSRELRMRANEFIVHFRQAKNSFHHQEARKTLVDVTDALDLLLARAGQSADKEAVVAAVEHVDKAYRAYRTVFYTMLGE